MCTLNMQIAYFTLGELSCVWMFSLFLIKKGGLIEIYRKSKKKQLIENYEPVFLLAT